jgi:outer membrane receptor protein involved in Fe transport
MGGKKYSFSNWLLYCFFLCTLALLVCGPAIGQEEKASGEPEEFALEEIVVTGSRIARNNNESVSPIVTVDEKLFDQSATSAIETQLNKLPQFTPTIDIPQIGGQDIQPTARNTPGEATVALRGIGANRTMVLINGRRGTPSNASGVLDINTIPTAAIEYVEAISGGASSTYGADAMAGVLNFIMKDTFEGFEIDVQSGITQEWDNFEYQISGIMGSNIADDRGNVMMAFSYNDRDKVLQKDRYWFRRNWADPAIGGTQFFPPYSGINLWYGKDPTVAALNAAMPGATFTSVPSGQTIYYDPVSGRAFTGFAASTQPGIPAAQAAGLVDGYRIKLQANGNLGQNNIDTYLIYPMDRFNMFTQGNYKINDYVGVFGMAYFSKVHAETVQEPGIITTGWGVQVDPDDHRASIPPALLTILDSRMKWDPTANEGAGGMVSAAGDVVDINALLPFDRIGLTDTFTFNMTAGLEGELSGIGWTWEAFASHGEAETTSQMKGFLSLERTRAIMELPEFGRGAVIKGNQYPPAPGFGTVEATCTSGLNPFDWASVTQDCWNAVKAEVKSKMLMEQNIYEANAQGRIMDLPGGEMRGALGASYRENNYYFLSDTFNSSGT